MYVCMYVYIYIYMYIYIHIYICIYVCIYEYVYGCLYVYIQYIDMYIVMMQIKDHRIVLVSSIAPLALISRVSSKATAPVLVCNYVEQISQLPWFSPRRRSVSYVVWKRIRRFLGHWNELYWLVVVWNIFIFPYIGNSHPNWLVFFRGVETTSQPVYII